LPLKKDRKLAFSKLKNPERGHAIHARRVAVKARLAKIKKNDPALYKSILRQHKKILKKWKAKNPKKYKEYRDARKKRMLRHKKPKTGQKKKTVEFSKPRVVDPNVRKARKEARRAKIEKLKLTNPEKFKQYKAKALKKRREHMKKKNPAKYQQKRKERAQKKQKK